MSLQGSALLRPLTEQPSSAGSAAFAALLTIEAAVAIPDSLIVCAVKRDLLTFELLEPWLV